MSHVVSIFVHLLGTDSLDAAASIVVAPAEMTGQANGAMNLAAAMMSMVVTFLESVKRPHSQVALSFLLPQVTPLSCTRQVYSPIYKYAMFLQQLATARATLTPMRL